MNPRTWLMRVSSLFRKENLEADLDQEIQEHLRMATEENISRGMSPREAKEAARRSFGGVDQMKEEFRDQRGIPVVETFARETRFALRSLRRAPGFTTLAVFTLALAIGANSAIFSAVNVLLLHPGGIADAGRVVVVRAAYDRLNLKNLVASQDNFEQVNGNAEIFSSAAIAKTGIFSYTGGPFPQRLAALRVSSKWFEVFGVRPALGRVFAPEEDEPNNNRVAVLSDAAWKRLYGGDLSILGRNIDLDRQPYKIVGIMPPSFTADVTELGGLTGQPPHIFVPIAVPKLAAPVRYTETFLCVARLRRGISLDAARAFMSVLTSRGLQDLVAGGARKENGWSLSILPYADFVSGDMKTRLLILWGAVGFVLLIACANIAGLTLARMSARSREFALRTALGGGRWQLLRQLLAESSLLALGGALAGLGLTYAFIRAVQVLGPQNVVGGLRIPFDFSTLAFTAAAALLSVLLFGVAPAGQIGRLNTTDALKEGGRSNTASRERTRFRSVLVAGEVALALILSIGAALLLRSLSRLQKVDPGFSARGVMSASVSLPETQYKEPQSQVAFYRNVIERLKALPGATAAAAAYPLPFGLGSESRAFRIVGRPLRENDPLPLCALRLVTPAFFSALRIPVKHGRAFTDQDVIQSDHVAVIDEALAHQYWPNQDPVGQQIALQSGFQATIVGIAGNTKQADLAARSEQGVLYVSLYQAPLPFATLIVNSAGNRPFALAALRQAVSSVDPDQALFDAKTMEERVSGTLATRRFTMVLLGLFATTAVFLAALGLYGVINYGVTQRTQEIGIRMALGAQRSQVLALIVGGGMRLTVAGLAIGGIAAYAVASLLPNQLFGVSAFDPATFAGMAILLAAVTLVASAIPARRAMNLDPLEACRYE